MLWQRVNFQWGKLQRICCYTTEWIAKNIKRFKQIYWIVLMFIQVDFRWFMSGVVNSFLRRMLKLYKPNLWGCPAVEDIEI